MEVARGEEIDAKQHSRFVTATGLGKFLGVSRNREKTNLSGNGNGDGRLLVACAVARPCADYGFKVADDDTVTGQCRFSRLILDLLNFLFLPSFLPVATLDLISSTTLD